MRRPLFAATLLAATLAVVLGFVHKANRVPRLPTPPGVRVETQRWSLQGETVPVDVHLPTQATRAPVVLLAHGFTRHRRVLAGWGHLLAQQGLIAVVPNLPAFADPERNARALVELADLVLTKPAFGAIAPDGRLIYAGHSMGGFASLLAAARDPRSLAWIGLDPVDFAGRGRRALAQLQVPALALLAEPDAWNLNGNARAWLDLATPSLTMLRVRGSTHCDPEHPTSRLAELACGRTDPERRTVYERQALALLRHVLFGQPMPAAPEAAVEVLRAAR
nr:lipase/esterase [uncultured bacterium]